MTQPSSPQDPGRGNLIRIRNLRAAALNAKGLTAALSERDEPFGDYRTTEPHV